MRSALFLVIASQALGAMAQSPTPHAGLSRQTEQAIRTFVGHHPSMVGRSFEISWREKAPSIPVCPVPPLISQARKDRPWGTVYLQVECPQETRPWIKNIQIQVAVWGQAWVSRTAIKAGEVVNSTYFESVKSDLSKYKADLIEDPAELEGLEAARSLAAGTAVRLNDFRPTTVIKSGDLIKLTLLGQGFEMVTSGQALSDAVIGATVRVRTVEGKTLQGKAVAVGRVEAVLD